MKINFKQFLSEKFSADEVIYSSEVRPISESEKDLITDLQKALAIIHGLLKSSGDIDVKKIHQAIDSLNKYSYFTFIQHFVDFCTELISAHGKMSNAKVLIKSNIGDIKAHADTLKHSILTGFKSKAVEANAKLKDILNSVDAYIDAPQEFTRKLKSQFTSTPSFFGSTRLISHLGTREYEKLELIDINAPLYTAMEFPKSKMDDVDYIIYFMLHLQTSDSPKVFSSNETHDFRTFQAVQNSSNEDYKKLMQLADKYLHNNDKKLIPEIAELIEQIPSLKAANDKMKKATSEVYRGIAIDSDAVDLDAILRQERESKYVATSNSKRAAKNFALRKGHLEQDSERRSEIGLILTYEVTPESILFDTKILATVYNESEIVIDATKAKLVEEEEV